MPTTRSRKRVVLQVGPDEVVVVAAADLRSPARLKRAVEAARRRNARRRAAEEDGPLVLWF